MVFSNYREVVRPAEGEKWFGITPGAVEAAKAARQAIGDKPANVVDMPNTAAAA
ncbi:MAG: hypothetical protein ACLQM8_05620 [Limisphaerales bacterium]